MTMIVGARGVPRRQVISLPDLVRSAAQAHVRDAIRPDTRVVIAHSLGSFMAVAVVRLAPRCVGLIAIYRDTLTTVHDRTS